MPQLKPRPSVAPEILAEKPLSAEVVVAPHAVTVTVHLPQAPRSDVDVVLTRHSIRIRHKTDPSVLNVVIPLPVAIEPERYVLRESHGVYDFVAERTSR